MGITPAQAKAARRRPCVVRTYEPRTGLVRESTFFTDTGAVWFMAMATHYGLRVVGCRGPSLETTGGKT